MIEMEEDDYHDATYRYEEELYGVHGMKPCPACSFPIELGELICPECVEET